MTLFWLVFIFFFVLMELFIPGLFFFLSFSIGSLAGFFSSVIGLGLLHQLFIALVTTVISLTVLFRIAKKMHQKYRNEHTSNIYALQGKKGIVIVAIPAQGFGQVKLNGEVWLARTIDGHALDTGVEVLVEYVRGAHIGVKPVNNER